MIKFSVRLRRIPGPVRRLLAGAIVAFLLATSLAWAQTPPAPKPTPTDSTNDSEVPIVDPCRWCTYWWCIGCE